MGFTKSFRKHLRRASHQIGEATGLHTKDADFLTAGLVGAGTVSAHYYAQRDIGRDRTSTADKRRITAFDSITRLLRQTGGHIPSAPSETATSVKSAKGSTLSERRRRGVFVIPRSGRRNRTTTRLAGGLNVPESRGINIVI